ncbi:phosphoribosyl-AMP cyclohydrolase [Clostridium pasteurianum DSM 525 = ATCC 6013]|uniref:Phosphoribosyl-AMP cyclohydrolase n=2 Tax=Clostridium pasteurianum TaxID=1501 RepID=A0A0H3JA84_CLOPA|nr:phosphoribosyl-AMP cyclohydrolase [Clostridium pasteurianum]AJA49328.1 phosphoribosyl-AMP cyclohydrolase [Clostridium pasteurianum DSM 525 = ATCC 6013]AJA53316.1 phosphoribosyl-AMP cyclohydrolase [Clostridium pasteurianum DSM 525 = ATCC 6013]AOZ77376.1 phosphoribosyl-AMP cyclohydrolase [Clostridium pasteurianum DSM 525 = ATCC 6013]AOZ81172.1 phosphoribosyl-AMP cyclohydrolase [Clostridium pasteurianum]KRU14659.1 Phosphoribosyl-AMP cyclohydrolase [Clostridium pasteurianum DSM 525 = ATCC 6013]
MNTNELLESVDFSKGLIPAIIVDVENGEVLMLAYMNKESLRKTMETKTTWFWSRSRNEYWNKGATSGHFQYVKSISLDCDNDTLLIKVEQVGAACHTGSRSCFFKTIDI